MRKVTWDEVKAAANKRKHRVSFELALTVFDDPFAISVVDRVEDNELRWRTIGMVRGMLLLVPYRLRRAESPKVGSAS